MLDLDPNAAEFFQSLPEPFRIALEHSNLIFHTVDDLRGYLDENPVHADTILYQQSPEPAIPSNGAYDPLDPAAP